MFKLCFYFKKIYAVCLKYSKLKGLKNIKKISPCEFVHLISLSIKVISIIYYVFSLNSLYRRHILLMMTVYEFLLLMFCTVPNDLTNIQRQETRGDLN